MNLDSMLAASDELDRSEGVMQSLLDMSESVVFFKDLQFRYVFVNKRYEEFFGVHKEDVLGQTDFGLFSQENAQSFRINDCKVLAEKTSMEFDEWLFRENDVFTYVCKKTPLVNERGEIAGICGVASDIDTKV